MKIAIVFVTVALCGVFAIPNEKYTTKYDNIDIDKILSNERLFNQYVKCLLDEGSCTAEGTELKRVLPDALLSECSKCSAIQKENSEKVFKYVYNNKRDIFDRLANKYDPDGTYKSKYSRFAEEHGIKL